MPLQAGWLGRCPSPQKSAASGWQGIWERPASRAKWVARSVPPEVVCMEAAMDVTRGSSSLLSSQRVVVMTVVQQAKLTRSRAAVDRRRVAGAGCSKPGKGV